MYTKIFEDIVEKELTVAINFEAHNCLLTPTFTRGNDLEEHTKVFDRFVKEFGNEDTMRFDHLETLEFVNYRPSAKLAINLELSPGFFCHVCIPKDNLRYLSVKPRNVYTRAMIPINGSLTAALRLVTERPLSFI